MIRFVNLSFIGEYFDPFISISLWQHAVRLRLGDILKSGGAAGNVDRT